MIEYPKLLRGFYLPAIDLYQFAKLQRLYRMLSALGGESAVDYAFAEASNTSLPLGRRLLAVDLAENLMRSGTQRHAREIPALSAELHGAQPQPPMRVRTRWRPQLLSRALQLLSSAPRASPKVALHDDVTVSCRWPQGAEADGLAADTLDGRKAALGSLTWTECLRPLLLLFEGVYLGVCRACRSTFQKISTNW